MHSDTKQMQEALEDFCDTIDATGGCQWSTTYQAYVPVGDNHWTDLAMAYEKACEVIGRTPVLHDEDREEEDE